MSRRSLTFRLVSWYCGLLFVLGVAFAIFAYASFDRFVAQATRSTLAGRADAVWGMAEGLLADKQALATLIEQRFAPEAQNRLVRISGGGQVTMNPACPTTARSSRPRYSPSNGAAINTSPEPAIFSFIICPNPINPIRILLSFKRGRWS
jgi:hypothetical protein